MTLRAFAAWGPPPATRIYEGWEGQLHHWRALTPSLMRRARRETRTLTAWA